MLDASPPWDDVEHPKPLVIDSLIGVPTGGVALEVQPSREVLIVKLNNGSWFFGTKRLP